KNPGNATITLETAHPSKFLDVMEEEIGKGSVEIPERLAILADREKVAVQLPADEGTFKDWLNR
ncbi:MAG: threonine synthase, partial [Verrucomicrobiaceae bacterium]